MIDLCLLAKLSFQLILNPIRDWNDIRASNPGNLFSPFQLILNPIRDWNSSTTTVNRRFYPFQLILNPIRDWNSAASVCENDLTKVPINLKPY